MNVNNEDLIKALETVGNEFVKIRDKYQKKAVKERAKVNDVYVIVCGEKCYTEKEINDWYAADYIDCKQSDVYIERLQKKRKKAGELNNSLTKSEIICNIMQNNINDVAYEILHIKQGGS